MANLKVFSPSLGSAQSYPCFDSVYGDKGLRVLTAGGAYKIVALDKRSLNSLRTVGSKLHVFDGSDEYLAALQEFNVFPVGPHPTIYYLDNFKKYFVQQYSPADGATITKTVAIVDMKGESIWNTDGSYYGNRVKGHNIWVVLMWEPYPYEPSTGTIKVNDVTVATRTVDVRAGHILLEYMGNHDGYINVTVTATNVERSSSYDFSVGVSAIDRVS